MLLTVDIGNSRISIGGFRGENLEFLGRLVTQPVKTDDQYSVELSQIMALHKVRTQEITGVILSSVVPELTGPVKSALKKITGVSPMVVGPGVKTGLNILTDDPGQLGADLVAGAVAAVSLYPAPCLVFDLGTATTISVIDREKRFLGCVICAGIGITLEALTTRTALLPHVEIEKPPSPIGKNSAQAMQSGLVHGTSAMLDGLAARLEQELGEPATLIVTGGFAQLAAANCRRQFIVNDNLLMEGLRILYEKNKKEK